MASDHGSIALTWVERPDQGRHRSERGKFKYELMWERYENFAPMMDHVVHVARATTKYDKCGGAASILGQKYFWQGES